MIDRGGGELPTSKRQEPLLDLPGGYLREPPVSEVGKHMVLQVPPHHYEVGGGKPVTRAILPCT